MLALNATQFSYFIDRDFNKNEKIYQHYKEISTILKDKKMIKACKYINIINFE